MTKQEKIYQAEEEFLVKQERLDNKTEDYSNYINDLDAIERGYHRAIRMINRKYNLNKEV